MDPEVVHVAIVLSIRDARFGPGAAEDEAFLAWLAKVNREILDGVSVADPVSPTDPATVLPYLPVLWQEFHRGCPLSIEHASKTAALVVVEHPTGLFSPLSIETHRRTLASALAKAGAAKLEVDVRTVATGVLAWTELHCRWP